MIDQPVTKTELWDALRTVCCTTGLKAKRIVMVNEADVEKAVQLIVAARTAEKIP